MDKIQFTAKLYSICLSVLNFLDKNKNISNKQEILDILKELDITKDNLIRAKKEKRADYDEKVSISDYKSKIPTELYELVFEFQNSENKDARDCELNTLCLVHKLAFYISNSEIIAKNTIHSLFLKFMKSATLNLVILLAIILILGSGILMLFKIFN